MQPAIITSAAMPINVGQLIRATSVRGIANKISGICSNSVVFSKENPIFTNYQRLKELVLRPAERVVTDISNAIKMFEGSPSVYTPITSVKDLNVNLQRPMQEAILTYPPVRELLVNNRISGYGINNEDLPCDDPWGRIINNGLATQEQPYCEYKHHSYDPVYEAEDVIKVEDTRWFISEFLDEQLAPDGDELDPTDYPNVML